MNNTTSLSFPNIFDIARNTVAVKQGNDSIVNRTRLLILTEPTELYNNPTFGVGLKKYLWQYNTPNTKAIICERIKNQLEEHEPCVNANQTQFADGLLYTESGMESNSVLDANRLKLTVGLQTIYQDNVDVTINLEQEQKKLFGRE